MPRPEETVVFRTANLEWLLRAYWETGDKVIAKLIIKFYVVYGISW